MINHFEIWKYKKMKSQTQIESWKVRQKQSKL